MNWKTKYNKYGEQYEIEDDVLFLVAYFTKTPDEDNVELLDILENPGEFEEEHDEMVLNFSGS